MAVKIRLTRIGKKKQPTYRVVVADSRAPRDGRYIEQIGRYDPRQEPSIVEIDTERATYWLGQGAQPSDAVRKLLEIAGALEARPTRRPGVHVVSEAAQRAAAEEAVATEAEAAEEAPEPATEPAVEEAVAEEAAAEATEEAAAEETAPEETAPEETAPEETAPEAPKEIHVVGEGAQLEAAAEEEASADEETS
jgi:small subunit ribosomal protein S16